MSASKILVSGATGLVGFHLCRYLLQQGHFVTGLIRKSSNKESLQALLKHGNFQLVQTELDDQPGLAQATEGMDVVIHAAGSVDPLGCRADIFATNVGGTLAMLEASIVSKVKQFIHISSLSVITGQGDQYGVGEDEPLKYCGEAYADSKVDAEKTVLSSDYSGRIHTTILRPGFIYGPGEKAWMPRLINSLKLRKAMLIDGGTKETNVIYVENLCRATALSVLNPVAYGQTYNLTDGQGISKKQLFDAISLGLGFKPITKKVPGWLAGSVCETVSTIAPLLPKDTQRKLARFSRAAFRLAGINQGFDIEKAERELGYTNRIPFAAGMAETLKSFAADSPNGSTSTPKNTAGVCR
jgi:2-alkyl-3-oxoalkanoate reductase